MTMLSGRVRAITLTTLAVVLVALPGRADIVHESSTPNPALGGGFLLGGGAGYVQGSRFSLDETTEIQFGGGRVEPWFGERDVIRISIVALEGNGLPAGTPATMVPLVSNTVASPTTDVDLLVALPITLPPGDYGLVLSNPDPGSESTVMPLENTNNPGASYFSGTSGGWSDGNGAIPGFNARFVLYNGCGNAVLANDETCDDGNTAQDDGCDAFCRDLCGDDVLGMSEDCDDANSANGDCCDAGCNVPPVTTCAEAGAGSLTVTEGSSSDKDKLTWKWLKGGAVDLADFGNPANSTSLTLCVDQGRDGDSPRNVGSLSMEPNAAWSGGEKLWKLKDKTGAAALGGISAGTLKPGAAGKSSITLKGGGDLLPALPLAAHDSVTVTMRSSDGQCWTSGDMPVTKSTDSKTIAKLP